MLRMDVEIRRAGGPDKARLNRSRGVPHTNAERPDKEGSQGRVSRTESEAIATMRGSRTIAGLDG